MKTDEKVHLFYFLNTKQDSKYNTISKLLYSYH
jgi:hypothetical protein